MPAPRGRSRNRPIALESLDLTVPSRTSSTSAVSISERLEQEPVPDHLAVGRRQPFDRGDERFAILSDTAAVSGDGAASPSETAAARRARPWRRRADRARFRASFATILSNHGRNGESSRNRGSA